jgi:hypothetical protein
MVLFTRKIMDVTGRPPWGRRNGITPVDYSKEAALKREHRDMMPESHNSGARREGHC